MFHQETLGRSDPDPADRPMVAARAVEKSYEADGVRVRALRGADLSAPRGEMVAVMGPSGCGKTMLLNVLSGLDEFDAGLVGELRDRLSGTADVSGVAPLAKESREREARAASSRRHRCDPIPDLGWPVQVGLLPETPKNVGFLPAPGHG